MGSKLSLGSSFKKLENSGAGLSSIGEGYAKQGKSWDEVASMPSSGNSGLNKIILSGVKAGYDNYMSQNKPANMIQSPGDSGLAASAVGTTPQPTLTSVVQNPIEDSTQFGNMENGSGVMGGLAGSLFRNKVQNNQGMQNQYGIIDGVNLI